MSPEFSANFVRNDTGKSQVLPDTLRANTRLIVMLTFRVLNDLGLGRLHDGTA